MLQASNVVRFPLIPRNTAMVQPAIGREEASLAIRMHLKEIIDIAYDGLLNNRELQSLERISTLFRG